MVGYLATIAAEDYVWCDAVLNSLNTKDIPFKWRTLSTLFCAMPPTEDVDEEANLQKDNMVACKLSFNSTFTALTKESGEQDWVQADGIFSGLNMSECGQFVITRCLMDRLHVAL